MIHPINEFVVKVASRCNLDCDYCYEYNTGDNTWKSMPKYFSLKTAETLTSRIKVHAQKHKIDEVILSFHGGEPLLLGPDRLLNLSKIFRSIESDSLEVSLTMQTNGTLLNDDFIEIIKDMEIYIAISIDGPKNVNDIHRLDHKGESTYSNTLAGLELIKNKAPEYITGILSVIDVSSDPLEVFDFIGSLGIRDVDFLLPHYNWVTLPPRPTVKWHGDSNSNHIIYGKWYMQIWNEWIKGKHKDIRIRFFENIIRQLCNKGGLFEVMNSDPVSLVTIATNGDIEGVDTLKSTGAGIQKLGVNIFDNSLDEVLTNHHIVSRQNSTDSLCEKCNTCSNLGACWGGYFPHRFDDKGSFTNTSVYCDDLYWLIDEMKKTIINGVHT